MFGKFKREFLHLNVVRTFSTISIGRLFVTVEDTNTFGDAAYFHFLYVKINEDTACLLNKPSDLVALNGTVEVYPLSNVT